RPRTVLRAPGRTGPRPGAPGLRRPPVAGHGPRPARRRPGPARRHPDLHGRHRRPQPRTRPVDDRGGHRRDARPDRQPGGRGGADPGQPHRRRVRRHPAVRHAARRRPGGAPRATPRHAAHQAGDRPGRHRQARRAPDDQHGDDRRDVRHRRRPATRLKGVTAVDRRRDMTSNGRRVAIVTGGSQGIGAGLVAGYRRQGWAVVASARKIKAAEDPDLLTVEGDLAEPATADRIVDGALERFGRIDTLVNNAGVYISKPFTDYTAADYALASGVNLAGFFWITQRAIAEMATRYGGHVVNITATLAEVANSGEPAVLAAMTKGGLAAATRSLAVEYASRGIRVNAVSPGIIQTPLHPAESYQDLGGRFPPLGRAGQVSDVVDAILFLESAPYITGEILHVDGGQTAGH